MINRRQKIEFYKKIFYPEYISIAIDEKWFIFKENEGNVKIALNKKIIKLNDKFTGFTGGGKYVEFSILRRMYHLLYVMNKLGVLEKWVKNRIKFKAAKIYYIQAFYKESRKRAKLKEYLQKFYISFKWEDTPEGHNFWKDIFNKIEDEEK